MYRDKVKRLLGNIELGDRIKIRKKGREYEGVLMPRSELGDDRHIVIKMDNGYNIGIEIDGANVELAARMKDRKPASTGEYSPDPKKPRVVILGTGGTIASKIDYITGAVHPSLETSELIKTVPELTELANIESHVVFNILSENMKPEFWKEIARRVAEEINSGASGAVVAHGTDTMGYTSAALSFMLKNLSRPVVMVGSQRSSDRPSSDSTINLISAVRVAISDIAEVTVVMHKDSEDGACLIHRGASVRKMHSSRRNAFRSVNKMPLGEISLDGKITPFSDYKKTGKGKVEVDHRMEEAVALVKIHPGFKKELMDYYVDNHKGLVIEGTGLGHVPEEVIISLERANKEGKPVVMTTQTLYGGVDMKVYSTGRRLLNCGVISGRDMLPEVALVKLMVALGRASGMEQIRKFMEIDIAGELSQRSRFDTYLS